MIGLLMFSTKQFFHRPRNSVLIGFKHYATKPAEASVVFKKITQGNNQLFSWLSQMLFALSLCSSAVYAEEPIVADTGVAKEILLVISSKQHPYLSQSNFPNRAEDLDNLYKLTNYQPVWLGSANSAKNINDAMALLNNAVSEGLVSASYDTEALQNKLQASLALPSTAYKELALYDTALSLSVLRYLHDLHYGRVNPHSLGFNLKLRQKKVLDLSLLIKDSVAQGSVSQLSNAAEPKLKPYQKLKQALVDYRNLAKQMPSLNLQLTNTIKPGEALSQSSELHSFLAAVGDLPADKPATHSSKTYSSDLAAGVKKFQLRHGMNSDGVLGSGTVAALNVPLKDRISQIELAMERLRWLPEPKAGRAIIVNIPSFQLWAFDDIDEYNADIPNMRVVVGKAMETQTPVLMARMSFIDFMPYWNVPNKITKEEILPKLLKNSRYLAGENMELVNSFGNEVKPVPFSSDAIVKIKQGLLRVRQRPGKKNALGKVKFIFPNKDDVYLHDTPASALFSKSRRDFSHGCVRVAKPDKLAEFALKDQWSNDEIQKALNTPKTQRVLLKKSIPVLFFYVTAYFDKNDALNFYADIYNHDATLIEALKKPIDLSDQEIFAPPAAAPAPETLPSVTTTPTDDGDPTDNLGSTPNPKKPPAAANPPKEIGQPAAPAVKMDEAAPNGVKIEG